MAFIVEFTGCIFFRNGNSNSWMVKGQFVD